MTTVVLFLNFALMIVLPIILARQIAARRDVGWRLFFIGAVTFIASQVLHIPFNWLVQQRLNWLPSDTSVVSNLIILSVFLGLSAGVFEEVARYVTMRTWAKDVRTWGRGLMLGAGHGGVEAIVLGALGLINFIVLLAINDGSLLELIPAEQVSLVQAQIDSMFNMPWYMAILGAVERVFALCLHLSLSLLVMQVFVRRNTIWLLAAIVWHALLDATAVFVGIRWGALPTEAAVGILALLSVGIIFWLRTPEPEPVLAAEPEPLPEASGAHGIDVPVSDDSLEQSKYS